MNDLIVPATPMPDLRRWLRDALENALPWFDRAAENRWRAGFERDLASSRETRADADRELAFANIKKAAEHFDVDVTETSWKDLGTP